MHILRQLHKGIYYIYYYLLYSGLRLNLDFNVKYMDECHDICFIFYLDFV